MTQNPTGTSGRWMALTAAILGWMFDGLEIGLFPLVARPALRDLLADTLKNSPDPDAFIGNWIGIMTAGFLVGAATGGVLFGWLGDRIGRVRAMTLSVLTYALFTGMCGVVGSAELVLLFRFLAALGMGGEWSLGVSLVMEIWPNQSRGWLAGLIGAAANVGFLLIALVSLALNEVIGSLADLLRSTGLPEATVAMLVANSGWRILMIVGALPAFLTFFIRLFVPESERWLEEKKSGSTGFWMTKDLAGVALGACGAFLIIYLWGWPNPRPMRIAGSALGFGIALAGYLYPVIRYLQRSSTQAGTVDSRKIIGRMLIGAALSGVALLGTWGSLQWAPAWADKLTQGANPNAKAYTQIAAGIGAIIGTILAAVIGNWMSRRVMYSILCAASLGSALLFFQGNTTFGWMFLATVGLAGGVTASFYGWLPLYLPELFPTRVRATGQGFAFNFGRILAAIGTLQTGYLMQDYFKGSYPDACTAMSFVYVVGLVIVWLAPETHGQPLPE